MDKSEQKTPLICRSFELKQDWKYFQSKRLLIAWWCHLKKCRNLVNLMICNVYQNQGLKALGKSIPFFSGPWKQRDLFARSCTHTSVTTVVKFWGCFWPKSQYSTNNILLMRKLTVEIILKSKKKCSKIYPTFYVRTSLSPNLPKI